MKVVLVQCTDSKRDEAAKARDLYDVSRYFRRQRGYAEAEADRWFVQSAEHGLVDPDQVLQPYNTRPSDLDDVHAWAERIAADLTKEVPPEATIEVLGGYDYADPLTPELEAWGFEVHEPLRGLRIGSRESRLQELAGRGASA